MRSYSLLLNDNQGCLGRMSSSVWKGKYSRGKQLRWHSSGSGRYSSKDSFFNRYELED